MRVEKSYLNNCYDGVTVTGNLQTVEQTAKQQENSEKVIEQAAASINISKLGYTYVGELPELPVYDSHEVYQTRREMQKGIDRLSVINGEFVGILADNYKSMADNVKENYTGDEYNRQMFILDRAYTSASRLLTWEYTDQIRTLSGDISAIPSTITDYYSSAAEAEAHQRESDAVWAAWDARKKVISEEKSEQISSDVQKYLKAAKASVLDKGFFDWQNLTDVKTDVLNITDLQKLGVFLLDKNHQTDVSGVSSFVSEIFSAFTNN